MWRSSGAARRAFFYTRRAASASLQSQVKPTNHKTVPFTESPLSNFSISSKRFNLYQNPRLFSTNPAQNHPEEPPISQTSQTHFDFGSLNVFDEDTKPEDSIFDDATVDNVEVSNDFSEFFSDPNVGNVGDGSLDSVVVEVEVKKTNDREKVESLLSLLQSSGNVDDDSMEASLEKLGLVLDEEVVMRVFEEAFIRGDKRIGFFKWVLSKPEFSVSRRVLDALVSVVCLGDRKSEAYGLWYLVKEIGGEKEGIVSAESLNELIAVFSRLGEGRAAFEVFNKFEEFGCVLNADSYYNTIEVLCKRSSYELACSVCEKMISADKLPDAERVGKVISLLCKGGMTKDAHLVYLYAKDKKIVPSQSNVDFLIRCLARIERAEKGTVKEVDKDLDKETVSLALEMLGDYSEERRKYAVKPFSSVVKKLCWIGDVDRAKKLLLEMIEKGPPPGNDMFNCVINGLSKSGDMKEALNILKMMESRGLKPDVYTYSVIMSGFARSGEMDEACKIFDEAKKKHSKLTPVTYHILIRGFCKLEQFDKAVELLGEMKQRGIMPSHDEYNKLIKSLCFKGLDWETAEKLEQDMRENGVILNGRTRALISAVKDLKEGVSKEVSAPA